MTSAQQKHLKSIKGPSFRKIFSQEICPVTGELIVFFGIEGTFFEEHIIDRDGHLIDGRYIGSYVNVHNNEWSIEHLVWWFT